MGNQSQPQQSQQWLNNPLGWSSGLSNPEWSQMLGNNRYGGVPGGGGPAPTPPYMPISPGGTGASSGGSGMPPWLGQMTSRLGQQQQGGLYDPMGVNAGLYGTGYLPMIGGQQVPDPTGGPTPQMPGPMGTTGMQGQGAMSSLMGGGNYGGFTAGLTPSLTADSLYALQNPYPTRLINQDQMNQFTASKPVPLEHPGKAKAKAAAAPAHHGGGGGHKESPAPAAANPGWINVGGAPMYVDMNTGQPMAAPKTTNKQQKDILKTSPTLANLGALGGTTKSQGLPIVQQIAGSKPSKFNKKLIRGLS